jgi:WD40 repeat protein
MKKLSALDKAAGIVMTAAVLLIGLVFLLEKNAGIRVTSSLVASNEVGPFETITLKFSEPVDPTLAESLVNIPTVQDFVFEWTDPQSLKIIPGQPFELKTIHELTVEKGIITDEGNELKIEAGWEFTVRSPMIAYLKTGNGQSSIWAMDLTTNEKRQLTDPMIKVMGFDASRDGEFIVFYTANEKGGIDLWRVGRAGGNDSVLLDCGRDRCTDVAISPDGTRVAYSREAVGVGPDLPYGAPRVWLLDLQSGQNSQVYEDPQILGYNPIWSPDGSQLASSDGLADEVRLLNINTGEQLIFSSNTGGPVTWSPDGMKFLFTEAVGTDLGVHTQVRMADLKLNETFTLIGENDESDYAYNSLAWSPIANEVLLGKRATPDNPGSEFWLFDPGRLDGIVIAGEPDYSYGSPSWDVWGKAIVFQQFKLKGVFKPEIGMWSADTHRSVVIADGIMVQWLP